MPLPNLIVIGAMKAGSTSLHQDLDAHPEIAMARDKEVNFFCREDRYKKGLDWYSKQFDDAPIRGETSPNYAKHPLFPDVARRIASALPEAKLIYIVRDPLDRAASHYHHARCDDLEHRPVEEAFAETADNHYVRCSMYATQLRRYLSRFSMDSIAVIDLSELKGSPQQTLQSLYSFLKVGDPGEDSSQDLILNRSADKGRRTRLRRLASGLRGKTRLKRALPPALLAAIDRATLTPVEYPEFSDATRARLQDTFRPDVDELRRLTGLEFGTWSV